MRNAGRDREIIDKYNYNGKILLMSRMLRFDPTDRDSRDDKNVEYATATEDPAGRIR